MDPLHTGILFSGGGGPTTIINASKKNVPQENVHTEKCLHIAIFKINLTQGLQTMATYSLPEDFILPAAWWWNLKFLTHSNLLTCWATAEISTMELLSWKFAPKGSVPSHKHLPSTRLCGYLEHQQVAVGQNVLYHSLCFTTLLSEEKFPLAFDSKPLGNPFFLCGHFSAWAIFYAGIFLVGIDTCGGGVPRGQFSCGQFSSCPLIDVGQYPTCTTSDSTPFNVSPQCLFVGKWTWTHKSVQF